VIFTIGEDTFSLENSYEWQITSLLSIALEMILALLLLRIIVRVKSFEEEIKNSAEFL